MKTKVFSLLVVVLMVAACGPSKKEIAEKERAEQMEIAMRDGVRLFSELRSQALTGPEAERKVQMINQILGGLGYEAIGTSQGELRNYVRAAHSRDVSRGLAQMRHTKANAARARDLKDEVMHSLQASGMSLREFNTSETLLVRTIQRNLLEEVQAAGKPVTPAMYRAAGLAPNTVTVVRRVYVPAKRLTPASRNARRQ